MTRKNRGSTRNSAQFSQTECGVQVRSVRKKGGEKYPNNFKNNLESKNTIRNFSKLNENV